MLRAGVNATRDLHTKWRSRAHIHFQPPRIAFSFPKIIGDLYHYQSVNQPPQSYVSEPRDQEPVRSYQVSWQDLYAAKLWNGDPKKARIDANVV